MNKRYLLALCSLLLLGTALAGPAPLPPPPSQAAVKRLTRKTVVTPSMQFPMGQTVEFSPSASLVVPEGVTATIRSTIDAGPRRIFSGAGTIQLQDSALREVLPEWFGAIADSTTDNSPMFEAILRALSDNPAYGYGGRIRLGAGTYRLSRPLILNRQVILSGAGGGWYPATTLRFDPGVPGIIVHKSTATDQRGYGDFSVIEHLVVTTAEKRGAWDGITLQGPATLRRVTATGWPRHGIYVDGTVGGISPALSRIEDCEASHNGTVDGPFLTGKVLVDGDGIRLAGTETSICTVASTHLLNNAGWGARDEGGYGNLFLACHARTNRAGSYSTGGDSTTYNRTLWIACYSEADQGPASFIASTGYVIGGHHGSGIEGGGDFLTGSLFRYSTPLIIGLRPDQPLMAGMVVSHGNTGRVYLKDFSDKTIGFLAQSYPDVDRPTYAMFGYGVGNSAANTGVGVGGEASTDSTSGVARGGEFVATGNGGTSTAVGVYGKASGGATNWAGKFEGDIAVTGGIRLGNGWLREKGGVLVWVVDGVEKRVRLED